MAEHLTLEFLTGLALGLCIGALLGGLIIGGIVAYLLTMIEDEPEVPKWQ